MKNKMEMLAVGLALLVAVLSIWVGVLAVGLAYERGHNSGYDEGWNDGTAYAESRGWQNNMW